MQIKYTIPSNSPGNVQTAVVSRRFFSGNLFCNDEPKHFLYNKKYFEPKTQNCLQRHTSSIHLTLMNKGGLLLDLHHKDDMSLIFQPNTNKYQSPHPPK